ncbi:MAG: ZIP family metal transporter [Candidatus Shapirobacteria bacterium]|jgi:zinc and cadmium transporter
MSPLFSSLIAVFFISLVSLSGLVFLFFSPSLVSRLSPYLVSFAVGSLLGDAFIHILPESFSGPIPSATISLLVIAGLLLNFTLEKFLRWRHCHNLDCPEGEDSHSHIVALNTVGDAVHNFIDGMLIAAAFMVSRELGLATTLAVLIHEIPQEIGDYAILVHSRVPVAKALLLNFLSALISFLGVFLTFFLGTNIDNFAAYLLPVTAGAFIYLAASDLIPELHRHSPKISASLIQLFSIIVGVGLMFLLLFVE